MKSNQDTNDPTMPDPDDEVESFWAWLFVILLICAIIGLCIGKAVCIV